MKYNLQADYMEVCYEHIYDGEGSKGQLCDLNEEYLLRWASVAGYAFETVYHVLFVSVWFGWGRQGLAFATRQPPKASSYISATFCSGH
ncbi:hypothetical protein RO3G_07905 [Rhizopus delemar RA 99-880]|uniref:Uncharacterized protein n=1 Tax=Rhizopus delemar (strain RA 99-880 / ATCC MYA-4621 / FGSC 9543 / NRRL 43880) TaxID=246409 RepID=I1C420_RHIO9|nr:hypothetical protein RO3G_07905 [Rhizopus delemar RA 99-880]|eukprot:EIE83200.1 hypothetical protein RO3G_07905 [Rhizopus delemar RA 99-880]